MSIITDAELRASAFAVQPAAGENRIGIVRPTLVISTAEFTRPNDTTAYAANDVIGSNPAAVMTFTNCGRVAGGNGVIRKMKLFKSATGGNGGAGVGAVRLYLFSVAPTAVVDNSPWVLKYAERADYLAQYPNGTFFAMDLLSNSTAGSTAGGTFGLTAFPFYPNIPFVCAGGDTSLYGVLVLNGSYTPIANETFSIELTLEQN